MHPSCTAVVQARSACRFPFQRMFNATHSDCHRNVPYSTAHHPSLTLTPLTHIRHPQAKGVQLLLPTDVVVADKFDANANTQTVPVTAIPDGWMGLDIGPDSVKAFQDALADAKTVVWNGPMGVFEFPKFANGTVVSIGRHGTNCCKATDFATLQGTRLAWSGGMARHGAVA